ncbi:MAG TPA: LarC family nickel insertion protein, partial [Terriglobia bacterium]|nr:LarC family nickel insertion protein [Terriglobia bacterium]
NNEVEGELVTPTGAAILSTLCSAFGEIPPLRIEQVGCGAGSRDYPDRPNVLRAFLGEIRESLPQTGSPNVANAVTLIEANIDDMNPQFYGYLQEKMLGLGALDFFTAPVQMKKNRPGTLLTVVVPRELLNTICGVLFEETTTLGVRYYEAGRMVLEREVEAFETEWGTVWGKLSKLEGRIVNFAPEYEDCRRLAIQHHVPLKWIHSRVVQEFMSRHGQSAAGVKNHEDRIKPEFRTRGL